MTHTLHTQHNVSHVNDHVRFERLQNTNLIYIQLEQKVRLLFCVIH